MGVQLISGVVGQNAQGGFPPFHRPDHQTSGIPQTSSATSQWAGTGALLTSHGGLAVEIAPGLAIVADAQIDNAPDLRRELGLGSFISTEKLIVAAYRRWQEDCPAHLEGDFAFAIWDARENQLLCARDSAGIRPFYYANCGGVLRFAQSAGALAWAMGGKTTLRDEAIADYLYGRVIDAESTFFEAIRRLEAGHVLVMKAGNFSVRRYYELTPSAPAGRDAPEEFRYLLDEAVHKCASGYKRVGALLSGGLDSSSIACLMRDRRRMEDLGDVPIFSMVFREPERSNERPFVEQVLAGGGFAPHVLSLDGYRPLDGLETLLEALDGPTHAPNLACMRHVVGAAADSGIEVLLDGHGGDEVVSHGYGHLNELASHGAWWTLWREARAAADNYGHSSLSLTRRVAMRQTRLDARLVAQLLAPFDRITKSAVEGPAHLLSRDLIDRSAFKERLRSFARPEAAFGEMEQHRAVLCSPLQPYAFEVHAGFYRSMGIEARYPFWDRPLVEFCLGLPASEKLSGGWSRLVLRRAMAGIVPATVLARRDKLDFTVHLARGLTVHHRDQVDSLFAKGSGDLLAQYCELGAARRVWATICADPDAASGRQVQMVWRAVALGTWLKMLRAKAFAPMPDQSTCGVSA